MTSSVVSDTLVKALLRGCRCIEIDVWDGEPKPLLDDAHAKVEDGKKHRFRAHMPKVLSSHRHSKDDDQEPPAASNVADEDDSLKMPTPWTSASTARRAEPRVLHGHTLTKEVPFRDVCSAIMAAAFVHR